LKIDIRKFNKKGYLLSNTAGIQHFTTNNKAALSWKCHKNITQLALNPFQYSSSNTQIRNYLYFPYRENPPIAITTNFTVFVDYSYQGPTAKHHSRKAHRYLYHGLHSIFPRRRLLPRVWNTARQLYPHNAHHQSQIHPARRNRAAQLVPQYPIRISRSVQNTRKTIVHTLSRIQLPHPTTPR